MKGDASCHIPNDKYREQYDKIFGNRPKGECKKKDQQEKKKK